MESLHYWKARFTERGVVHGEISTYAQHPALEFEDSEGLRMVLVVSDGDKLNHWEAWDKSTVPAEHQIQGMGPVEITVSRLDKLAHTLIDLFGYTEISRTHTEAIFQSVHGEKFGEIVVKQLDGPSERPGRGSVHHLAIRVKTDEELGYWDEKIKARGLQSSGIVDRYYFKSLYVRETNGILFELSTDEPGFMIDGDISTLGEKLDLPPFLEDRRSEIESILTPIEQL